MGFRLAILAVMTGFLLTVSGCAKSYVTDSGQIMDANGNPLYPPLQYQEENNVPALRKSLD